MISKPAFYAILVLVVIGLAWNIKHHIGHDSPTVQKVKDEHVHHYYWSGVKDNPNQLVRSHNETYGVPKDGVKHRHTGADYMQHGMVTWKHVNDQHVKLQK